MGFPLQGRLSHSVTHGTRYRDRMLASALNFAIGFFGYPFEGQYEQSITIEENGVSTRLMLGVECSHVFQSVQ